MRVVFEFVEILVVLAAFAYVMKLIWKDNKTKKDEEIKKDEK